VDLIFYNQAGEPFFITEGEWDALFRAAVGAGWRPAGTLRPPIAFDLAEVGTGSEEPWNRGYVKAQGQTVQRSDARSLAAALRAVEITTPSASLLADYCERGGFLMCPGQGASMGSQLLRMNNALRQAVKGTGEAEARAPVNRSLRK
jgi:hypothetical protein